MTSGGPRPTKTGKGGPGARTKLTTELQETVCELLRAGNYLHIATSQAGISPATHHEWIRKGEEGTQPYADYKDAVTRAWEAAEVRNVTLIQRHAQGDWRAAAWYLERSRRENWGKTVRNEITGPDGGPVEIVDPRKQILDLFPEDEDGAESV